MNIDDDGGAEKSSSRLYRRKLHTYWKRALVISLVVIAVYMLRPPDNSSLLRQEQTLTNNANRLMRKARNSYIHKNTNETNGHGSHHRLAQKDTLVRNRMKRKPVIENHDDVIEHPYSPQKKYRWADNRHLPPLPGSEHVDDWWKDYEPNMKTRQEINKDAMTFKVIHRDETLDWETYSLRTKDDYGASIHRGPKVNYVNPEELPYDYPEIVSEPPTDGSYPPLQTLESLLKQWPQDDIDHPPSPIMEQLQHFDYMNLEERQVAVKYRDLELPFKMTNVPEIDKAGQKWTDEYLIWEFDRKILRGIKDEDVEQGHKGTGHCQESVDSFFSFYQSIAWVTSTMGPPPTKDNDFSFSKWAKHARYADDASIPQQDTHYYWQSGTSQSKKTKKNNQWSFIGRDLPSFSAVTKNFFLFEPEMQKGIQCRFGERGVTAATHYDSGRNMVAMITGAKRYILSPPNECSKLGIISHKKHSCFRHSLLNFGHISLLDSNETEAQSMPSKEREWLEIAKHSLSIETVLKAGEVLYIPSHWFHYIIGLQKSAQCNTRSGKNWEGNDHFGGYKTVHKCLSEDA